MKLWAMVCRSTQDGRVTVESSDNTWSTGKGKGKPLQYFCLENPMNSMKSHWTPHTWTVWKDELPSSVGAQYASGDQWRSNSRKKEEVGPKQKQSVVNMTGDGSKVWCCKEQYCIGTWNVHESRQIASGQTGDGKSEYRHFRSQRTNMDWNGWI